MKYIYPLVLFTVVAHTAIGQAYTSYFTGNNTDVVTAPLGGNCLMGGATEDDEAMKWFLQRANGGDILVLRASGSNGYNNYLYSELGVDVNSVETIVFHNASASNEPYVHQRIQQAEAIWFAGGDQWNYISYWRNTPVDSLINVGISERNIVIGGTSAGMAIQGSYYFSAQNNTVTSNAALQNPYNVNVTVDGAPFLNIPYMDNVITDTHYDNPDRKGRHSVFLARILTDDGVAGRGIACDEYTAVCIDENGLARVYGGHPTYDDNAYFIQVNCELNDYTPETCTSGMPLTWNRNGEALKVYAVKGTSTGANTFDLTDWQTGTGGTWQHWSIEDGVLTETAGSALNCQSVGIAVYVEESLTVYPNPASDYVYVQANMQDVDAIQLFNSAGKLIGSYEQSDTAFTEISVTHLDAGIYFIQVNTPNGTLWGKFLKSHESW